MKGKGKGAEVPVQQEQGISAFESNCSSSERFFGGALAEIYEHVEGHRNEFATILDVALTSLRMRDCFATFPLSCITC